MHSKLVCLLISVLLLGATGAQAFSPLGTAISYQGRLVDASGPVSGNYDFTFALEDAATAGTHIVTVTNLNVSVTNGLFTTSIDFGSNIFIGYALWVEISVRTNSVSGTFTTLSPRQPLAASPNAQFATLAATVPNGSITPAQLGVGSVGALALQSGSVTSSAIADGTIGPVDLNLPAFGTTFWGIAGNSGTTAGSQFLGTTDNQPLEIHVNNTRALRIEPHATAAPSLAGGYYQNSVAGFYGAVVAGGGTSAAANGVSGNYAFVGAGYGGNAGNNSAVIAGAYNSSPVSYGFIGTGLSNTNLSDYSFIGDGANNQIQGNSTGSYIGGGANNVIPTNTTFAFVGGGNFNSAAAFEATVVGGTNNTSSGSRAAIGGGANNIANANAATIAGGSENLASGDHATVGGGQNNGSTNDYSTVSGGFANIASSYSATVSGGQGNTASGGSAAVGGGYGNTASGDSAAVGGGFANIASGSYTTVGGGYYNIASNDFATVSGGCFNVASGQFSFAAGYAAQALHQGTFVWADSQGYLFDSTTNDEFNIRAQNGVRIQSNVGIHLNAGDEPLIVRDWDVFATNAPADKAGIGRWGLFMEPSVLTIGIPGDDVSPRYFQVAKYSTNGTPTTLMWVDQAGNLNATSFNAAGGGTFTGNGSGLTVLNASQLTTGTVPITRLPATVALLNANQTFTGANLFTNSQTFNGGIVLNSIGGFAQSSAGTFAIDAPFKVGGRLLVQANGNVGISNTAPTHLFVVGSAGSPAYCDGGSWVNGSDRNAKEGFLTISARDVLERVSTLPITRWKYKTESAGIEHLGPMAQDFHTAFGLNGHDDTHISTVDEGGVALAAIQGLNEKMNEKDSEIQKLKLQNESLQNRLDDLEQIVQSLRGKN